MTRTRFPFRRKVSGRAGLCFALALLFVVAPPPRAARAVTCSTTFSCDVGQTIASTAVALAFNAALNAFIYAVQDDVGDIVDRLSRVSNNDSQSTEARNRAFLGVIDQENSQSQQMAMGSRRSELARTYQPGGSTCALITRTMRVVNAEGDAARRARQEQTEIDNVNFSANLPGGPSERGAIGANQYMFRQSLDGFCDSAVLNPPPGINCTLATDSDGRPMAWRFAQPYQAIFRKDSIPTDKTNPENRAARLFAQMVIEPVSADPIRGPVVGRDQGRVAFLLRQRDIAAYALAKGTIDRIIDDRLGDNMVPGSESLHKLRMSAWQDAALAVIDMKARAGTDAGVDVRDLPLIMRDINMVYLQLYRNLERMAVLKASYLARQLQQQNSGSGTAAGRIMQAQ